MINLSDPDSRVMRTQGTPPRQAYNAQTAVNEQQVILAAEITVDAPDFGHLEPMLDTHPGAPRQARRDRAARGGARGRRLLAYPADPSDRANAGSRCSSRPTERCARATAGLGARLLRCHARQARHRPRPQALRPAQDHHRAGLRLLRRWNPPRTRVTVPRPDRAVNVFPTPVSHIGCSHCFRSNGGYTNIVEPRAGFGRWIAADS